MSPTNIGVRLDAIADQDVVGLEGVAVEVDGKALGRLADDDGFHARADRAADERLGDAVGLDDAGAVLRPCRRRGCPWRAR